VITRTVRAQLSYGIMCLQNREGLSYEESVRRIHAELDEMLAEQQSYIKANPRSSIKEGKDGFFR
jgi:hypothetical protein